MASEPLTQLSPGLRAAIDQYLDERLESQVRGWIKEEMEQDPAAQTCRIIASKGTLDWAYPPLILASTAAALGMDTSVFCTFYGLELLRKNLNLKMDPVGNPAMPMPVPNLLAILPGMRSAATAMMGGMFKKSGVASIPELRKVCLESGVKFIACQMTVDVMGYKPEQFIDGVEFGGAAVFMSEAARAHTTLFI